MQELFWFFLGGFVYLMVDRAITFYKKVKFLNDIKILSYKLIGYAYQQWATITAAKYIYFEMNEHDAEEVKIMKNVDEADLAAVADQFEAIFLENLLKQARESKLSDSLFETNADDNFVEMFDKEIANTSSKLVDIGIAEAIIRQMSLQKNGDPS